MIKTSMDVLSQFAPEAAGRCVADIFEYTRTLSKKPPKDVAPLGARFFPIEGTAGVTRGYQWGTAGRSVLLVHGWGSDSRTMYSFARSFVSAGFSVATFDAPAHGVSPGNVTTLMCFKNAIRDVIISLGNVVAVVAHSIGAITSMGAIQELAGRHRIGAICLFAPPVSLPVVIERWSRGKFSDRVVNHLNAELWRRNGVPVQHWDMTTLGKDVRIPVLVMHDPADPVVPLCDSEIIVGALPHALLEKVPEAGRHLGILSNAYVIERACRFVIEQTGRPVPMEAPTA